jgi:hypothetical protein
LVDDQVDQLLGDGLAEEGYGPWAAPVVIVTKHDGTPRFCVDYRKLNNVTKKDAYPLPRIEDCVESLSGSKWFCTLDLASGYWQVPVAEKDRPKTGFVTRKGLFQFKVLPFGLCNAPATFERLMELVLRGLQWESCLIYLDDVITFGKSFEEALHNLRLVFTRFRKANLKLKPKKCHLMQGSVSFLGHVVSEKGVSCDPSKIKAVQDWPTPENVTDIRSFLGLAGYY